MRKRMMVGGLIAAAQDLNLLRSRSPVQRINS